MYIGRDFKREIELNSLNKYASKLRPNRSWIDLFLLSLSRYYYGISDFDFTILTDNLSEDKVIIVDSNDDIFKGYQIHFWKKESISDILPTIKCPFFKSENKIFKTSEMDEIGKFINDQNYTKSFVIENTNEKLSINLVYGNTIKITPWTFCSFQQTNFFDKLQERYNLWEIEDCVCKPKKIRVQVGYFENLKYTIDKLKWISNIIDVKLGFDIDFKCYNRSFSNYDTMFFNHSVRLRSDSGTKFIFTGDTLAAVYDGNYYNFRLEERTKESKNSEIRGRI